MTNSLSSLIPLMQAKGAIDNIDDFHAHINQIFHNYEAQYYDAIHQEMWKSLPLQYQLLVDDINNVVNTKQNIKLLDIGCGTGLATDMLLATTIGQKITEVALLDTSPAMLQKAVRRSKQWNKKTIATQGDITQLNNRQFDLIIISSVLHHIPDLDKFLNDVSRLQSPGGVLITIHDPAEEAIKSDIYKKRCKEYNTYLSSNKTAKRPLYKKVMNKLQRMFKPQNYIENINKELLKKRIIKQPLTEPELWSVTDIHVEALPYSASNGIAKNLLLQSLKRYDMLAYRTYAFFGTLHYNLSPEYQANEQQLILTKDQFGRNFSSAWIKTA